MPDIASIRQQYPQYSDLSDQQLAQGLHQKFYSDMPFDQFASKIGFNGAATAPPQGTDLARGAALTGRSAAEGVVGTLLSPLEAIIGLENAGISASNKYLHTSIPQQETYGGMFSRGLTQAGAPVPQTSGENYLASGVRGAAGAMSGVGALANVVRGASALGAATSGATGALSSEAVRQGGGGPIAQAAAGLAGGLAPGAVTAGIPGTARALIRGGEAGRQGVQQSIDDFAAAGTTPTVGQAIGSRSAQGMETLLSRVPGGAGPIANKALTQSQDLAGNVENTAASLAPKSSGEQAGRAIERGISGDGGFVDQFQAKASQLYDQLDQHIPANAPVSVNATSQKLAQLTRPVPGAEAVSKILSNAKISNIADAFGQDVGEAGTLPYAAVKQLRSKVGDLLGGNELIADAPRAQLKQLYGALSSDMQGAANAAGPQAQQAFARANGFYKAGMDRIDTISSVIDKAGGPEAVFKAATAGTKEGASTLRAVMQSLPADAQQTVSATVIRRLGLAKPGAQSDLGDRFSADTFLSNWNGLSADAKRTLFDRFDPSVRSNLDQIASVASRLRDGSGIFRNPSGTAQGVAQATAGATFLGSLLTGHLGAAGTVAASVGTANLTSRLMTNPNFVRWLANSTKLPASTAPALVASLAAQGQKTNDPDLTSAAQVLGANIPMRAAQPAAQPRPAQTTQIQSPARATSGNALVDLMQQQRGQPARLHNSLAALYPQPQHDTSRQVLFASDGTAVSAK